MKMVSILIPAYNEELVLEQLYDRLARQASSVKSHEFEFLFVNDGSRDRTLALVKGLADNDPRVSYVNLSRNFGKEIAIIAGFDHTRGDAVIIIDADLQDPPELIPQMIDLWEQGYDDVYAQRRSRQGESWLKKSTSKLYYKTLQRVTNITIQKDTGDFRLLDKRVVEALKQFRETGRNTKAMFSWVGFNKKEILYDRDPRAAGSTHWGYWKLFELAVDGILSFTTAPLRISTLIGIVVSILAFAYLLFIMVRTLVFGADLAGYPSMMVAILFLGGVQLISLGIIGEYVGRIFNETKGRPLYLVESYHNGRVEKKARRKA